MVNGEMRKVVFGVFFLGAAFLLNFVIPPFQNPDEPPHFAIAMIYAHGEEHRDEVESEVIQLMDKYHWWKHVGMGRPAELPERLSQISIFQRNFKGEDFRDMHDYIVLYHFVLGKALGLFYRGSLEEAYFICRLVSILFVGGALILIFLSFRKIEAQKHIFSLSFLFVLFLPQFLLAAITVSSDALAVLLGCLFFYAALSLIVGERKVVYFIGLIGAAVVGFFTDRSVFLLIPMSLIFPFFLIKKEKYKESIVNGLGFLVVALMLFGIVANLFPLKIEPSLDLFGGNLTRVGEALPGLFSLDSFSLKFYATTMDGFFLKFGWMAFGLGLGFYLFWRLLVTLSAAGVLVFLGERGMNFIRRLSEWMRRIKRALGTDKVKKRWRRLREEKSQKTDKDGLIGKWMFFSLLAVLFNLIAAWTYYGSHQVLAQGRHFFPLIIPIAFLFVLGLRQIFDRIRPGLGRAAVMGFVVIEFFILNFVIWAQMVPVFHMMIKSPYKGM